MTNPFIKFTRLNPETGKREWLPDVPNRVKVAARAYKEEMLKHANRRNDQTAPGADSGLQA